MAGLVATRAKRIRWTCGLLALSFVLGILSLIAVPSVDVSGDVHSLLNTNPPFSVPTRSQLRSDTYVLEKQIRDAAGRVTSNATDGTGGSPASRSQTQATHLAFDTGIFNGTNDPQNGNTVILDAISKDDFRNATWNKWWLIREGRLGGGWGLYPNPGYWGLPGPFQSNGGLFAMNYAALRDAYGTSTNISIEVNVTATTHTDSWTVWVANAPQKFGVTDWTSLYNTYMIRVGLHPAPGGRNYLRFAYNDTLGTTHWYNGAAWTTTLDGAAYSCGMTVFPGGLPQVPIIIHIFRNNAGSNWVISASRKDTGATVCLASIAFASVKSGSGPAYFAVGELEATSWNDLIDGVSQPTQYQGVVSNLTASPTLIPATGNFTSNPFAMGEWTALLTKAFWNAVCSGGCASAINWRHDNDTNMIHATPWIVISNNTDVSAFNYRAAFFQYRMNFTATSDVLRSATVNFNAVNYGSPPGKTASSILITNTTWNFEDYSTAHHPTLVYLNYSGPLRIYINHTKIDGTNYTLLDTLFRITSSVMGGSVEVRVSNSTLNNFGNLTSIFQPFPYLAVGTRLRIYLDNVSLSHFNNVGATYATPQSGAWLPWFTETHEQYSTLWEYNVANHGGYTGCFHCVEFLHNKGYSTRRGLGNFALGDYHPFVAKWNYLEGGFMGIQWVGNISGVGPARSVEGINYSFNDVNKNNHSAYTINGVTLTFWSPNLGAPYYASVYKNIVSNSSYINFQTTGVGNITFRSNYCYGSFPSKIYANCFLLNLGTSNTTIDRNYMFDRNNTQSHISVTSFSSDHINITNNVLYDISVGGWQIELLDMGRKNPNLTSDYTYRGTTRVDGNWFDGNWGTGYIFMDMGYVTMHGNYFGPNHGPGAFPATHPWRAIKAQNEGRGADNRILDLEVFDSYGPLPDSSVQVFYGPNAKIVVHRTTTISFVQPASVTSRSANITINSTIPSAELPARIPLITAISANYTGGHEGQNDNGSLSVYPAYNVSVAYTVPVFIKLTITNSTNASVPWHSGSVEFEAEPGETYRIQIADTIIQFVKDLIVPIMVIILLVVISVGVFGLFLLFTDRAEREGRH